MSFLGHHHSIESKRRIGEASRGRRRPETRDEPSYFILYRRALARAQTLEAELDLLKDLNNAWVIRCGSLPVKTRGACLPATGEMLWRGRGFALVWFSGCDQPMVWPYGDLEVAAE